MCNRPLFDHNNTREDRLVGGIGLFIIYAILAYAGIKQIIKVDKEKHAKAQEHKKVNGQGQ